MGQENRPREKIEARKLLKQAAAWYMQSFQDTPAAQEALVKVGLNDVSLFMDFRIGFCNGTLKETVPPKGELRGALRTAGIITKDFKEFFEGCLVFPWFSEEEECLGMWGLALDALTGPGVWGQEGKYLSGPLSGVYNFPALKRSRSLLLTDSILRALFLYQAGFRDVVPLWGKEVTQDHLRLFQRFGTKQVVLTFEEDEAHKRLREEGIGVSTVELPEFPCPIEEIEKVLRQATSESGKPVEVASPEGKGYEETETGFSVQYSGRRYEVKGLEKGGVRLKASVKAYRKVEPRRFFLDSVDLYSNRSRILFSKGACGYFGEKGDRRPAGLGKVGGVGGEVRAQRSPGPQAPDHDADGNLRSLIPLERPESLESYPFGFRGMRLGG